jgi:CRISPR system Cascade subunit CasA
LKKRVMTPDGLDVLITAKNHDLKQAVAEAGKADDWIFALVSSQTGEGYGGPKKFGAARMNGGSSSRSLVGLAPLSSSSKACTTPRCGAWFLRDLRVLLQTRERVLAEHASLGYKPEDGISLVWTENWPEKHQIALASLDVWFVEACRRVRLSRKAGGYFAHSGSSEATRIDAKAFKGVIGDPWSPVHRVEAKSLTLGEGAFDYRKLTDLLFSGEWKLPLLAEPAAFEKGTATMALVCMALGRGNCKTDGFKERCIPLGGRVARSLGPRRHELHELAKEQIKEISEVDKALAYALALAASGGDRDKIKKDTYKLTTAPRGRFDAFADEVFFESLWARFEAQEVGAEAVDAVKGAFVSQLITRARKLLVDALPGLPCTPLYRPRATARARDAFEWQLTKCFEFSGKTVTTETTHAA